MNFKILNPATWGKKAYELSDLGILGWLGFSTKSGEDVNRNSALDVPAVFAAVRAISEGMAQMPQVLKREEVDEKTGLLKSKIERQHWAHRLLAERPNSWQTPHEFVEGMVFNAALEGSSIAVKVRVGNRIAELLPIPAGSWTVEQLPDYSLRYRVDHADKTHSYFSQDQIFHLRGPGLNGYAGLPAIRQAREAIGLSLALEKHTARIAGSGGTPSGALTFSDSITPEQAKQIKADWSTAYGPNGDGGIAVLDKGAKFEPMAMNMVDAQTLESRRFQIEEIGRAFRVMPIMLMQSDKASTYASAEQMFRVHVIHTLGPWISRWENAVKRDILATEKGLRVDLDERALLRGDFKDQGEYYTKALGAGGQPAWMTQNEVRAERGMNPVDDPAANKLSTGAMNNSSDAGAGDTSPMQDGNSG